MKLDLKSLTVKMWVYFMAFTGIILIVLWCLQIIFINGYYKNMKLNQIAKAGNYITENFNSDDIQSIIYEYSFRNNLFTSVLNKDNYTVFSSDAFGAGTPQSEPRPPQKPDFKELTEPENEPDSPSGGHGVRIAPVPSSVTEVIINEIRPFNNARIKAENFESFKLLLDDNLGKPVYFISGEGNIKRAYYASTVKSAMGEELYLLITSPVPPLDSTVEILKNQLIMITGFLLLMAFVIAYIFSKRLAKPVIRLTDSARQLAGGDFNTRFETGAYSEIDQLANTLNYATKELSRVEELRRELIANISHDLRTPLTIIKFYGEMIRDISGGNPEKRNQHAELIMAESDKLTSLVNEILHYSKIQSDNYKLNVESFNLSERVMEIVDRFHVLTDKEGYSFVTAIEKNLYVNADPLHIERVIYNLIGNAVNYTGDDKTVFISLSPSDDGCVRFEVTDTGPGIPTHQLQDIWERYFKVKESHRRAVVGNGLGLSIVKNILEKHGAAFGVKSAENKGSMFWFELKCVPVLPEP